MGWFVNTYTSTYLGGRKLMRLWRNTVMMG